MTLTTYPLDDQISKWWNLNTIRLPITNSDGEFLFCHGAVLINN